MLIYSHQRRVCRNPMGQHHPRRRKLLLLLSICQEGSFRGFGVRPIRLRKCHALSRLGIPSVIGPKNHQRKGKRYNPDSNPIEPRYFSEKQPRVALSKPSLGQTIEQSQVITQNMTKYLGLMGWETG